MIIGDRLRSLREHKNLSQGDIQKRTGLLRCYVSRVENGYTVPSFPTLEKFARALEVPMYQLFYDGENQLAPLVSSPSRKQAADAPWGDSDSDSRFLDDMRRAFSRMDDTKLNLLYTIARHMAKSKAKKSR